MEDHIEPAGWALGLSGVAMLLGAFLAYRTGELRHDLRTHMDATLVLGWVGVVLVANGLVVIAYGRDVVRRRERAANAARLAAEEQNRREAREALRAQQQAERDSSGH